MLRNNKWLVNYIFTIKWKSNYLFWNYVFVLIPINYKYNSTSITRCVCLFSHPVVSSSSWSNGLQHTSHPCPSPSPGVCQLHVHCTSDAIQPSHHLMPSSPSALNLSQHQGLFQWVGCLNEMTKILELHLQHHPSSEYSELISLKIDWFHLLTVQETFRSLLQHHSSKVYQLFGVLPSLQSSSHNCMWSLGRPYPWQYVCWQSNASAFQHAVQVCHSFPAKNQSSSDFMAAVTICTDFGAHEEEICHCIHLFPFYSPWSDGAGWHDLSFFFSFFLLFF